MLSIAASSNRLNDRVPICEKRSGRRPAVTIGRAGDKFRENLQDVVEPSTEDHFESVRDSTSGKAYR